MSVWIRKRRSGNSIIPASRLGSVERMLSGEGFLSLSMLFAYSGLQAMSDLKIIQRNGIV